MWLVSWWLAWAATSGATKRSSGARQSQIECTMSRRPALPALTGASLPLPTHCAACWVLGLPPWWRCCRSPTSARSRMWPARCILCVFPLWLGIGPVSRRFHSLSRPAVQVAQRPADVAVEAWAACLVASNVLCVAACAALCFTTARCRFSLPGLRQQLPPALQKCTVPAAGLTSCRLPGAFSSFPATQVHRRAAGAQR